MAFTVLVLQSRLAKVCMQYRASRFNLPTVLSIDLGPHPLFASIYDALLSGSGSIMAVPFEIEKIESKMPH